MTALRRGWFHLASGAGIGRLFGFLGNLLLSRWLGPSELGLFNLIATSVQTSDTLVRCGGDYALNYELGGQAEVSKSSPSLDLVKALAQICSLATLLICIGFAIWAIFGQGLFSTSLSSSYRLSLITLLLLMIACEGISASGWEVLLVSARTAQLALRQGLFFPLRLSMSAFGSLIGGVPGAMCGWSLVAITQIFWLKTILREVWNPLNIWPLLSRSVLQLLKRGLPFYFSNLFASIVFYPLLLNVATSSGLNDVGYLRVGQILQQLFAFLPATLVPVLFLQLRAEPTFDRQILAIEKPFRLIWFLLIQVLLVYSMVDHSLIQLLFGQGFSPALLPTRILLITALFECLTQVIVQPLLASGFTRLYAFWYNGSALLAAVVGSLWIPKAGLSAFLVVKLVYVLLPLIAFGVVVHKRFMQPQRMLFLMLATLLILVVFLAQTLSVVSSQWHTITFAIVLVIGMRAHWQDFLSFNAVLRGAV